MDIRKRLLSIAAASAILLGAAAALSGASAGIGAVINTAAADTVYDHTYSPLAKGFELTEEITFTTEGTSGKVRIDTEGIPIYSYDGHGNFDSTEGQIIEDIDKIYFYVGYSSKELRLYRGNSIQYDIYDFEEFENLKLKYDAVNDCFAVSRVRDSRKTSVEYEQSTMFTVTIPAKVSLGDTAEITAEDVCLYPEQALMVGLTGTSETDNTYKLKLKNGSDKIGYAVKKLDKDDAPAGDVNVGDYFLSAETDGTASQKLLFEGPLTEPQYVGTYSGTVTFTIAVFGSMHLGFTEGEYFQILYASGMTWAELAALPENSRLNIEGDYIRVNYEGRYCKIVKIDRSDNTVTAVKTTDTIITDNTAGYYPDYNMEQEDIQTLTFTAGDTTDEFYCPKGLGLTWRKADGLSMNYRSKVATHLLYVAFYYNSNYYRILKNGTDIIRCDEVLDPDGTYTVDLDHPYNYYGYPEVFTIGADSNGNYSVMIAYTSDSALWSDVIGMTENFALRADSEGYVEALFNGSYHRLVYRTTDDYYNYQYATIKAGDDFDRDYAYYYCYLDDLDKTKNA